ncbi:MAG: hypothetical protein V2I33_16805, partial [Kangiellaceae bacterium]|nr:hypothetical protein [Kangiellaceae bacterium]
MTFALRMQARLSVSVCEVICSIHFRIYFAGLRSELQSYYKRRLASIRPMPWLQEIHLNLTEIYVKRQLKLKTN